MCVCCIPLLCDSIHKIHRTLMFFYYLVLQMNDLIRLHNHIDIEVMEEIIEVVKPFKDTTQIMSTETSSSISLIRPLFHEMLEATKPMPDIDRNIIHEMKASMFHDLETR